MSRTGGKDRYLEELWGRRDLKPTAKHVLATVLRLSNASWVCNATNRKLESETGLVRRSVQRYLLVLERKGVIRITRQDGYIRVLEVIG